MAKLRYGKHRRCWVVSLTPRAIRCATWAAEQVSELWQIGLRHRQDTHHLVYIEQRSVVDIPAK